MKTKTILIATTLAALGLMAAACKPKVTDSGIRFVAVKDGLNMREEPSPTGKKMLTIPYRQEVQKLEEKPESFTIDRTEGKWTKVSWKGKTGWVFGGFLTQNSANENTAGGSARGNTSIEEHFASIKFEYRVGSGSVGGDSFTAVKYVGDTRIQGEEGGGRFCAGAGVNRDAFQGFKDYGYVFEAAGEICGRGSEKCTDDCTVFKWHCSIMASDILDTPAGGTLEKAQCDERKTQQTTRPY